MPPITDGSKKPMSNRVNSIPPGLFVPCSTGGGPFRAPLVFVELEKLEHSNLAR